MHKRNLTQGIAELCQFGSNERSGVDAGPASLFAFWRPCPGATHRGVVRLHMNTCPHCNAIVNPLRVLITLKHYRCGHCRGLARVSEKQTLVFPAVYAVVIFPFIWFSPREWVISTAGCLFAVFTIAHIVAVCFLMRFEPAQTEDSR